MLTQLKSAMVERREFARRVARSIRSWVKTKLGKGTVGLAVIVGVLGIGQYYDFTLSQLLNPTLAAKFPKIGQMLGIAWSWVEELHPVFWVLLGLIAVFEAAYRINRHFINRAKRDAQLEIDRAKRDAQLDARIVILARMHYLQQRLEAFSQESTRAIKAIEQERTYCVHPLPLPHVWSAARDWKLDIRGKTITRDLSVMLKQDFNLDVDFLQHPNFDKNRHMTTANSAQITDPARREREAQLSDALQWAQRKIERSIALYSGEIYRTQQAIIKSVAEEQRYSSKAAISEPSPGVLS
jgi:hypothetical protein